MLSLQLREESSEELIFEYGPPLMLPRYTLYPETEVEVLAFQDKFTMCWIVAPEPLAVSNAVLELLVKKEMLAEAVPVVWGANVTVKGML